MKKIAMMVLALVMVVGCAACVRAPTPFMASQSNGLWLGELGKLKIEEDGIFRRVFIDTLEYRNHNSGGDLFLEVHWQLFYRGRTPKTSVGDKLYGLNGVNATDGTLKNVFIGSFWALAGTANPVWFEIRLVKKAGGEVVAQSNIESAWLQIF